MIYAGLFIIAFVLWVMFEPHIVKTNDGQWYLWYDGRFKRKYIRLW